MNALRLSLAPSVAPIDVARIRALVGCEVLKEPRRVDAVLRVGRRSMHGKAGASVPRCRKVP